LDGNIIWNCKYEDGLVECEIIDNELVEKKESIIPNSPLRNYFEFSKITYNDKLLWAKKSLINIAGAGRFAADRSIREYAENIWNLKVIK
jgi:glucan phosphorylase